MAKLLLVSIPMMFILLPLAGASPRWISGVGSGLPHRWQQPAFQSRTLALGLRGGAKKSSKQAEESESEDLDDDFGDDDFGDASAADFEGEDTLGRRLVSAVNRTPPITQGFLTLSIAITLGAMLFNGNQYPRCLLLDWSEVLHGQVWRLLTAFMYFGPFDISFALTIQFVWQYMSQLEKVHHKEPEQFVIMWVTGAAFLLAAFACTALPTAHLGHNLSCFLVYVWARTYEGHEINFMELFTMRSELMPWFLALQTLLLEGEFPLMDLVGIAVGHVYYVLYSAKALRSPLWLSRLFSESSFMQRRYAAVADDFGLENNGGGRAHQKRNDDNDDDDDNEGDSSDGE